MKEASDPKLDGFMSVEEIVTCLATGWILRRHGGRGYDGDTFTVERQAGEVRDDTLNRLMREGWLRSSNGLAFFLSDEGHKAYLRSTDEMGDGKLIPPVSSGTIS